MLEINRDLNSPEYQDLLKTVFSDKRERIIRFKRFEDAQRCLLGDVLLRKAIMDHIDLPVSLIKFAVNEYGKPFLENVPNFHFNLSHAGKYVACAVGDTSVGIDVEILDPINLKIAERYFCGSETEYILSKPNEDQTKAFYEIWTKKEAYIKYKGKGLSISLNTFNVLNLCSEVFFYRIYDDAQAICHVCSESAEKPSTIYIAMNELLEAVYFKNIKTMR